MTINEYIINAISDLAPCFPREVYQGNEDEKYKRYFVFNYDVRPTVFSNDEPILNQYSIQLHYFCPLKENSLKMRRDIKKRIFDTGVFTYPDEINGTDTDGQYYCYEFYGIEGVAFDDNDGNKEEGG